MGKRGEVLGISGDDVISRAMDARINEQCHNVRMFWRPIAGQLAPFNNRKQLLENSVLRAVGTIMMVVVHVDDIVDTICP